MFAAFSLQRSSVLLGNGLKVNGIEYQTRLNAFVGTSRLVLDNDLHRWLNPWQR